MFVVMSCVLGWVGLDVRRAKGVFKKVEENHRDRLTSEMGSTKRRGRSPGRIERAEYGAPMGDTERKKRPVGRARRYKHSPKQILK
jgi:hypothetical protein